MQPREVLLLLQGLGAIVEGHFVYTSGHHGDRYVNKDALYPHVEATGQLCRAIAEAFASDGVQVVVAPAVGGVVLTQWTTYHLIQLSNPGVLSVYAEKAGKLSGEGPRFSFGRGYDDLVRGKRVLVVEDVLTTGGSARDVVEASRLLGATVVGVGVLCNRGRVTPADLGDVPKLHALMAIDFNKWPPAECRLCQQEIPINTDVGHGRVVSKNSTSTAPVAPA